MARHGGGPDNGRGDGVCHDFQRTGECSRKNCRFAHVKDGNSSKSQDKAPTRANETPAQQEARKSYNRWLRLLGTGHAVDDPTVMKRVWQGAFEILEAGDRDWTQQLPVDLGSDDKVRDGRQHILAIMSARVQHGDYKSFVTNCRYFLLTLSHPALVDSLAVDTYVGSLYNFMSGTNGARAVTFAKRLAQALVTSRTDGHQNLEIEISESTLRAATTVLAELLRREPRARLHDDLPSVIDALANAAGLFAPDAPTITFAIVEKLVADMRAMVARANGLLVDDREVRSAGPVSSYPRTFILPSGRYDNDKQNIAEMTVFPTRDEILSDAEEFLPFTDYDQPHFIIDLTSRHIDTHFRLLRHDVFGDLKEALAALMHAATQNEGTPVGPQRDISANHYSSAFISDVDFSSRQGLHASITFSPPSHLQKQSAQHQMTWWTEARRLQRGALLSFIWKSGSDVQHMFFTCVKIDLKQFKGKEMHVGATSAVVKVQLVTSDELNLRTLMQASLAGAEGILLEFPRIIPATFVPILNNLQDMHRHGRLSFRQYVVPERLESSPHTRTMHDVPPPMYSRAAGFSFPLGSITHTSDHAVCIDPTDSCDDEILLDKIEKSTSLDQGQCRALVAALTREFALIQGPPGTGKSYIGLQLLKILLAVKKQCDLGPILIISYTNHALDQFLEHLIKVGVRKVIRVGGQSKSNLIQEHNLRSVGKEERKTKAESWMVRCKYDDLSKNAKDAATILQTLRGIRKATDWRTLKEHLAVQYHLIHEQFPTMDEEGYELVGQHPFDVWAVSDTPDAYTHSVDTPLAPAASIDDLLLKATKDAYSLTHSERQVLLSHWVREMHDGDVGGLFQTVHQASKTSKELGDIHSETDRRVLQEADVVGVTTSRIATRIALLKKLRCKVLVCKEAGEILEAHMISASLPSVEHCIQIRDHEQLRPSVNNYNDLSLESRRGQLHQLNQSQFKRLAVGEPGRPLMPVAQLNVQRRMRPKISVLIRRTIYNQLVDHDLTKDSHDVVRLQHNVFWLDHDNLESASAFSHQNSKSKSNNWEVNFVQALVRHIVRQGVYSSADIAVLTPYTGQLQKLRTAMQNDYEIVLSDRDQEALIKDGFEDDDETRDVAKDKDVDRQEVSRSSDSQLLRKKPLAKKRLSELLRLATVDNFQGEEAKVVVVSLVRSNKDQKVGFLRTSNRINVLLSRAQHGRYVAASGQRAES